MSRPVLILQHMSTDGPAALGTWLHEEGIAVDLRDTEAGDDFPDCIGKYRALAVLGGEMSANDPLPSLRQAESLIRQAVDTGIPVIGHCLGGQLMAKALGARVGPSPASEIGWHDIDLLDTPATRDWFGDGLTHVGHVRVFQWHHEAFTLPAGAIRLAGSRACPNQAFSLGPHLAMQFHVELDADKLWCWTADNVPEDLAALKTQSTELAYAQMRAEAMELLPVQIRLARRLYARWMTGAN